VKILPTGAALLHAGGWMDGHNGASSRFFVSKTRLQTIINRQKLGD